MTTCLVGTPPLRLHLLQPERRDTISQNDTSQETDSFASRTPLTPTSLTPTPSLDTNDISLGHHPLS